MDEHMDDDLGPTERRLPQAELREVLFDPMCNRTPEEIEEYVVEARVQEFASPRDFVLAEEGTVNPANGHFLCTECYIKAGMPSASHGRWVCP